MTLYGGMDALRQRVREVFCDLGGSTETQLHESILIQNGLYCGRKLTCNGLLAIWFEEEDELKIYRDGELLFKDSVAIPA